MARNAGRRGNGEGALFPIKSGPKAGQYLVRVKLPNGKPTSRFRATRAEALEALQELQQLIRSGTVAAAANATGTFRQWLDEWVPVAPDLEPAVRADYASLIKNHIAPFKLKRGQRLGDVQLGKLDFLSLQALVTAKAKTLSASRVRHIRAVLAGALEHAVDAGRIAVNYAKALKSDTVVRQPIEPYRLDQIAELRAAFAKADVMWQCLLSIYLLSGARRGEGLGLRWSDVDWEHRTLRIQQNLRRATGLGVYATTTKNGESRPVPIPLELVELLKRHKASQKVVHVGGEYGDLVFTRADGRPLSLDAARDKFHALLEQAGIEKKRLHDLRHTFGSLAVDSGVDSMVLKDIMGHKDIRTTQIYVHPSDEAKRRAVDGLAEYLKTGTR